MADGKNKNSYENPMKEDRAREGKKSCLSKNGFCKSYERWNN